MIVSSAVHTSYLKKCKEFTEFVKHLSFGTL